MPMAFMRMGVGTTAFARDLKRGLSEGIRNK